MQALSHALPPAWLQLWRRVPASMRPPDSSRRMMPAGERPPAPPDPALVSLPPRGAPGAPVAPRWLALTSGLARLAVPPVAPVSLPAAEAGLESKPRGAAAPPEALRSGVGGAARPPGAGSADLRGPPCHAQHGTSQHEPETNASSLAVLRAQDLSIADRESETSGTPLDLAPQA